MPLASILIPTYNRASFIERCLLSAIRQTFADIEIVVADNASTDNTVALVQRLARGDARVRLLQNSVNLGPVRNWLRCAEEARGELTLLLFSDDWVDARFLAATVPQVASDAVSLAYTGAVIHGLRGAGSETIAFSRQSSELIDGAAFVRGVLGLSSDRCAYPVSPGCALLRRTDLIAGLREAEHIPTRKPPYEHGIGPDLFLLCRTATTRPHVAHISETLAHFSAHAESITIASTSSGKLGACYGTAAAYFTQRYLNPEVGWELATRLVPLYVRQQAKGDPFGFCCALRQLLGRRKMFGPSVIASAVPASARLLMNRLKRRLARGRSSNALETADGA